MKRLLARLRRLEDALRARHERTQEFDELDWDGIRAAAEVLMARQSEGHKLTIDEEMIVAAWRQQQAIAERNAKKNSKP